MWDRNFTTAVDDLWNSLSQQLRQPCIYTSFNRFNTSLKTFLFISNGDGAARRPVLKVLYTNLLTYLPTYLLTHLILSLDMLGVQTACYPIGVGKVHVW